jgi:hypothetical protein
MNKKWSVRNFEKYVHQLATGDNYLLEVFSDIKISFSRIVIGDKLVYLSDRSPVNDQVYSQE